MFVANGEFGIMGHPHIAAAFHEGSLLRGSLPIPAQHLPSGLGKHQKEGAEQHLAG